MRSSHEVLKVHKQLWKLLTGDCDLLNDSEMG